MGSISEHRNVQRLIEKNDQLRIDDLRKDCQQFQAEQKALIEILSQKDATIRILTKRHKLDQAEKADLKTRMEAEKSAAEQLCKIYFDIAERFISASRIRQLRDEKIQPNKNN